mmetsp:Transcript_44735/g.100772  ORF Transcript_44735/g.100772 Transcript_44735/m.100772 type:complete len:268 (+) Transcript_44735:850-1653(+)
MARNSSADKNPSPDVSAASNRLLIFRSCSWMAVCFCRTMMLSSVAATLNVSCMNTPLMIPTTANPMVNLCITAKSTNHSVTSSDSKRHTGGQFAKVISNIDSMALENVPKYSYTRCLSSLETLSACKYLCDKISVSTKAKNICRMNNSTIAHPSTEMLPTRAVVIKNKASKTWICRTSRINRRSLLRRAMRNSIVLIGTQPDSISDNSQTPTMRTSTKLKKSRQNRHPRPANFTQTSMVKRMPKNQFIVVKNSVEPGHSAFRFRIPG